METEYKILLLEESETDAELIMEQVLMSGFNLIFKRAVEEDDFKEEIRRFKGCTTISLFRPISYAQP